MPHISPQSYPVRVCQVMGVMDGSDAQGVVMDYYRHMDRSRVQFDFVATSDSRGIPRQTIEALGGRVYLIPSCSKPRAQARYYRDLFQEHWEWDIVHTHMGSRSGIPLREAARCGVHVRIAHAHDCDAPLPGSSGRLLWRSVTRAATIHMASTEEVGRQLYGDIRHTAIIPDALDLSDLAFSETRRHQFRSKLNAADSTLVIGCVGPIADNSQLLLLDAFAELLESRPDSLLVLMGEGDNWRTAEDRVLDLGIWGEVRFEGPLPRRGDFLNGCDFLVVPANRPPDLPRIAREGLASGLPVLLANQWRATTERTEGESPTIPLVHEVTGGAGEWAQALRHAGANHARASSSYGESVRAAEAEDIKQPAHNLQIAYEMLAAWAQKYSQQ